MDPLETFIVKDNKPLRCGYTTGSCAAAAAKAAAIMLLSGHPIDCVSLLTPKGVRLELPVREIVRGTAQVSCAVRKYSGDDPDVTNGVLVYATVKQTGRPGIVIDGGTGVGRVTKPGLDQPVGAAAINRVPRQMIREAVVSVQEQFEDTSGLYVEISIPEGVALAEKTFNPRLGIVGGISVLGTSGMVEPMSDQALLGAVRAELNLLAASGETHLLLTPGNYGQAFLQESLPLDWTKAVKCSNFIGDVLKMAAEVGMSGVLLVGHIGKLVKLAGGMMNTHSRYGDCRMEILAAHTALQEGGTPALIRQILDCSTTEQALDILLENGMQTAVMQSVLGAVQREITSRISRGMTVGIVLFSNQHGLLAQTEQVPELLGHFRQT